MSNLSVWTSLALTDNDAKKDLNFGRKTTAIDATWQVWRMTDRFGKVGEGWGWDADDVKVVPLGQGEAMILVTVSVWSENKDHRFGGFTGGCMLSTQGKVDTDAGKKATTDALTKAFSHLGMSADVFMNKFHDNKYFTEKPPAPDVPLSGRGVGAAAPSKVTSLADGAAPVQELPPVLFKKVNETQKTKVQEVCDKFVSQVQNASTHDDAVAVVKKWTEKVSSLENLEALFTALKPSSKDMIALFGSRRFQFTQQRAEDLKNGTA